MARLLKFNSLKQIIVRAIIFIILLGMVACGGGSNSGDKSNTSGNKGTVTGKVLISSSISQAVSLNTDSTPKVSKATSYAAASETVPVPGAICAVEGTDKSGTSDQDGLFTISDVSVGSHILICKKTLSDSNIYAFLKIIEVADSQNIDIGTMEVTLTGKIQGRATMSGLVDHSGIKVYIPGTSIQATTDSTGLYSISDVPAGTYELNFEKTGYMTVTLPAVTVTAGQSKLMGDVALNVSTGASGSILINNGNPYSTSRTVSVSVTASANATLLQISENSNFVGAAWQPIAASIPYTFTSDGQNSLYIKVADANGLESAPLSATIIIDTVAPTVVSTVPASNAANVAANSTITAHFSESIIPATLNNSSFTIVGSSGAVNGTVAIAGDTATFTPTANLVNNETYTATITTAVQDLAGNAFDANYSWSFTTGSPKAVITLSTSGALPSGVSIGGVDITLTLAQGITLQSTINPPETDPGVVVESGVAAASCSPHTPTISAVYTAPTNTVSGKIRVGLVNACGFGIGEFATIYAALPPGAIPQASDFSVISLTISDMLGAPLSGISAVIAVGVQ